MKTKAILWQHPKGGPYYRLGICGKHGVEAILDMHASVFDDLDCADVLHRLHEVQEAGTTEPLLPYGGIEVEWSLTVV